MRRCAAKASPARPCSSSWSRVWTTSSTDWDSVSRAGKHGSYLVKPGDTITAAPSGRQAGAIREAVRSTAGRRTPAWLTVHPEEFRGQVLSVPSRDQIDTQVEEQLIVEYYSNR